MSICLRSVRNLVVVLAVALIAPACKDFHAKPKDGGAIDGPATGGSGGRTVPDAGSGGKSGDAGTGGALGTGGDDAAIGGTPDAAVDGLSVMTGSVDPGQPCLNASECKSGSCRDSVCCSTACDGKCVACAEAYTGMPNGTCAPSKAGMDPHESCAAGAPESCGDDGTCDGKGACRKYASNQICGAAACSGTTFSAARTCDGLGACGAAAATDCGTYPCTTVGCAKPCTTDTECGATNYCVSGLCKAKKTSGETCTMKNECSSGFCADGVCCQTDCAGACLSCAEASTGQKSGSCQPVSAGKDPDSECPTDPAAMCGRDGWCDGKGACRKYDSSTKCADASCTGATFTPARTCAAGACTAAVPVDCKQAMCSVDGCRTGCAADTDCATTAYCAGATCATRKSNGDVCAAGNECSSRACVDGVCCETACTGTCYACAMTKTGQANGKCAAVTAGTDKDNECADLDKTTCGTDGMCDGAGACRKWAKGSECAAGMCNTAGNYLSSRTCDGLGTCSAATVDTCAPSVCAATGCVRTCTKDTECVGDTYCKAGTCAAKQNPGVACTATNQCKSGFCADGVCCDGACTGKCYSCVKAKSGQADGTCGAVPAGQVFDGDCTKGAECTTTGFCDGKGACQVVSSGAACGTASCAVSTLTSGGTCDGVSACTAGTANACPKALICASTSACKTNCASTSDCTVGNYCANPGTAGTCNTKKGVGIACTAADECAGGSCVDGFCCNTACAGTCQACSNAKTGVSNGTCAPVLAGVVDSDCAKGSTTCGLTGACDGAGACQFASTSTGCGTVSCNTSTNVLTAAGKCDGSGVCSTSASTMGACPGLLKCASVAACISSCAADTDCVGAGSNYCVTTPLTGQTKGQCVPRGDTGAQCSVGTQCKLGFCVGGVCCGTACNATGACQECSTGTCNVKSTSTAGTLVCSNACVATKSDVNNCNGCGMSCPTITNGTRTCSAGTCGGSCATGLQVCGATCIDCRQPNATNNGCGVGATCNNSCKVSQLCAGVGGKPDCGSWDFESETTEGWALDLSVDPPYPSTTISWSTVWSSTGTHSLAVPYNGPAAPGRAARLRIQFCSSGANLNLGGRRFHADLLFKGGNGTIGSVGGSLEFGQQFHDWDFPLPQTAPYSMDYTFVDSTANALVIYFTVVESNAAGTAYQDSTGTMYLDNISMQ